MKLSIITPVVNESESVNICIQQWAMTAFHDDLEIEVIIADNGSNESHLKNYEKLQEFHHGFEVKVISYPYPGRVIPAKAKAYEQATGDYLLFADAHILYYPGSFASSIALFQREDIGAVCMLHNHLGMTPVNVEFLGGDKKCYETGEPARYNDDPRIIFMSGYSGTMIKREWYDKLGRLFPDVFEQVGGGYCADEDLLCTLTWLFGKKVILNSKAIYWHLIYKHNGDEGKVKGLTDSLLVAHYLKNGDDPEWHKWVTNWRGSIDPELLTKIPEIAKEAREYIKANSKWKYSDLFKNWEKMLHA